MIATGIRPETIDGPAIVEVALEDVGDALPVDSASAMYRIGPVGVFDDALTAWIPIAGDADVDGFEVYYFSDSPEHRGWYPADQVIGWLVAGSDRIVVENGQTYVEIQVNHSGIVQLATRADSTSNAADIGILVGLALCLSLAGVRRAHALRK